jgi:hypothetical protein
MIKGKNIKALSIAITCSYLFGYGFIYASTETAKSNNITKTKTALSSSITTDKLAGLIISQGKKAVSKGLIKPSSVSTVITKVNSLNSLLVSCVSKKRDMTAAEANTALGLIGGIDYSCVANANTPQIQQLVAALDNIYYRYQELYKLGIYTSNKYPKLKNTLWISDLNGGFFSGKVQSVTTLASNALNFFNTQLPGIWKTIKPSNPKELVTKTLLLKGTSKEQFNAINPENLWKASQLKDLVSYAHTANNTFKAINTVNSKLNKLENTTKDLENKVDEGKKKLESLFK